METTSESPVVSILEKREIFDQPIIRDLVHTILGMQMTLLLVIRFIPDPVVKSYLSWILLLISIISGYIAIRRKHILASSMNITLCLNAISNLT